MADENDIDIFGDWLLEEVWHASMRTPRSYPGSHDLEGEVLEILGLMAVKPKPKTAPLITATATAPAATKTSPPTMTMAKLPASSSSQPTMSMTRAPVTSSSARPKISTTASQVTAAQAASAKAALQAAQAMTTASQITASQAAAAKVALAKTVNSAAVSKAAAQAAAKAARDVAAAGNRLVAASRKLDKKLPSFAKKAAGKGQSVVRKSTTIKGEVVGAVVMSPVQPPRLPGEAPPSDDGAPMMQMQQLDPTAWHNYMILAGVTNAVAQATEMADAVYTLGQKLPPGADTLTTQANDLIDRCSAVNDAFDPNADPPDGSLIGIVQVIGLDVADWTSRAKLAISNPASVAAEAQTGAPAGTGAFDPGTAGGGGGGGSEEEPAGGSGGGGAGGGGGEEEEEGGAGGGGGEDEPMEDGTPTSESEVVQQFRDSGGEWDPFADEGDAGGASRGDSGYDSGEGSYYDDQGMEESTPELETEGEEGSESMLLPDEKDAHATLAAFRASGGAIDPLATDDALIRGDAGGMAGGAGGMSGGGYDAMFSSLAKDAGGIGEAAQGKKREKANIVTDILNPLNLITVAIESGGNKDDAMIRWGLQEAPPGPQMHFITVKTTRPDGTTAQDRLLVKDARKLALARKKMIDAQQQLDAYRAAQAAQAAQQQPEAVFGSAYARGLDVLGARWQQRR